MTNRAEALEVLQEAINSLEGLRQPRKVEPTLDAIAAALKLLLELPDELARRAVALDELLAWLVREGCLEPTTARAASRLLEAASVEGYAWDEGPDDVDENDKEALLDGLRSLQDDLSDMPDDDDDAEDS
jgi:hypothetical protein